MLAFEGHVGDLIAVSGQRMESETMTPQTVVHQPSRQLIVAAQTQNPASYAQGSPRIWGLQALTNQRH